MLRQVAYAIMQCLSVCLSVRCMNSVKTNKRIFKIFSTLAGQNILVIQYQTSWQFSNGALNAGGVGTSRDSQ